MTITIPKPVLIAIGLVLVVAVGVGGYLLGQNRGRARQHDHVHQTTPSSQATRAGATRKGPCETTSGIGTQLRVVASRGVVSCTEAQRLLHTYYFGPVSRNGGSGARKIIGVWDCITAPPPQRPLAGTCTDTPGHRELTMYDAASNGNGVTRATYHVGKTGWGYYDEPTKAVASDLFVKNNAVACRGVNNRNMPRYVDRAWGDYPPDAQASDLMLGYCKLWSPVSGAQRCPDVSFGGPVATNIQAVNIDCAAARRLVTACGGGPCHRLGFTCESRGTAADASETRCVRGRERVSWQNRV